MFIYDTPFWDEQTDYDYDIYALPEAEHLEPPDHIRLDEIYADPTCLDCSWALTVACTPYLDWLGIYHNSREVIPESIPGTCEKFHLASYLRPEEDYYS